MGWLDVLWNLRHNPVYHHLRRLRARRMKRLSWFRRNPVVILLLVLLLGMMILQAINDLTTILPGTRTPWEYTRYLLTIPLVFAFFSLAGWLLQAVYRYVHDTLGLLSRCRGQQLRSMIDDDLAISSLDDREILAGAFWELYRTVLPPVVLFSLVASYHSLGFATYLAYAPANVPDWFAAGGTIVANALGVVITNTLGTLLSGLALVILGTNLENPRLQPVTATLATLGAVLCLLMAESSMLSGYEGWTATMTAGLGRLLLILAAGCFIPAVCLVMLVNLRLRFLRELCAWFVPGLIVLTQVVPVLMIFFGNYLKTNHPWGIAALNDTLIGDFLVVLASAFDIINPLVRVIPVDLYSIFTRINSAWSIGEKDYLWVAWWYFPVLTATQLLLAVGLGRLAAAAVALRRRAVR